MLAASQSPVSKAWFQGTADAVRQYMWLFEDAVRDGIEDFLILAGAPAGPHAVLPGVVHDLPTHCVFGVLQGGRSFAVIVLLMHA